MKNILTQLIILALLVLSALGLFEFQRNRSDFYQKKVEKLRLENDALLQQNEKLSLANRLLKVNTRRARIEVLGQEKEQDVVKTSTIRFTEFAPEGNIVAAPREFTLVGDKVYVDALVVKFDDEHVEKSDPLRSRSLCSFLRIFGEHQNPADGFPIDAENTIPSVYRSSDREPSAFEKDLWKNFWEISNAPEKQRLRGIHAIHGEAPSQKLEPGRIYNVELRSSGGLSITVE
ncbi:MAG: hypothetical protein Q4D98_00315 [Planctomycetia bacterium]|nr:hypothetical protein [Planctomycetia bacterium]